MNFHTYPGMVDEVIEDRVPALRFQPGDKGYARFVSLDSYTPPVKISGWMKLEDVHGSSKNTDGLHVHVGHIGNARNYVCSLVRRDNNAKIAVEYGWRGYRTLTGMWHGTGPEFVSRRTYLYEVVWDRSRITTWVGNETGQWTMEAKIPEDRYLPMGSIGFRLDNLTGTGNMTVREQV